MDFLFEKYIARGLRDILGDEVWLNLSKTKRMILTQYFVEYGNSIITSMSLEKSLPDTAVVEEIGKEKLKEVERLEILSLLKNDKREFPDVGLQNFRITNENFRRLRNRMEELLSKLKELKFEHPDAEKRRLQIIDAIDNRASIPGDDLDLWVINHILPGVLDESMAKKIDEWIEETKPK